MASVDFVAWLGVSLGIMALGTTAYQTWLTRKALQVTTKAVQQDQRSRYLEHMPTAHVIIQARVQLQSWSDSLKQAEASLSDAVRLNDEQALLAIAAHAPRQPRDVIGPYPLNLYPAWLRGMILCGAQHFYSTSCNFSQLAKGNAGKPWFSLAQSLVPRAMESRAYIEELLKYLEDILPPAYLHSPASISDSAFDGAA